MRPRYLGAAVAAAMLLVWVVPATARAATAPVARYVYQVPGSGYGPGDKVVALTFDDGPWAGATDQIESILMPEHAPATFFQIGRQANAAPQVTHRLATLGFGIGDHTWDHVDLSTLPPSGYPGEVGRTISLLTSLAGRPVTCTRPPDGRFDATTLDQLGQRGQTLVLYSADTRDWTRPGVDTIVSRALAGLTNGSIILMHDGGGDRSQTVAALPQIIAGVRARGFTLVPICGGHFPGPVTHDVPAFGSVAGVAPSDGVPSNLSLLGAAATPTGRGYWTVASDGGVFSFGDAGFYGSTGGLRLNQPVVGMAATPSGHGYWLVASDGGIFTFGDAGFFGSTGSVRLNRAIIGMAPTPSGQGYWLVASDGGIFTFGDAGFSGSTGGLQLNQPVVGMAATPSGQGYWLVASDGGIFTFGDARFSGSTGGLQLNEPVVGMAATPSGHGYWLVASDGGIFTFGDAGFFGSAAGVDAHAWFVAIEPAPDGAGYWIIGQRPA